MENFSLQDMSRITGVSEWTIKRYLRNLGYSTFEGYFEKKVLESVEELIEISQENSKKGKLNPDRVRETIEKVTQSREIFEVRSPLKELEYVGDVIYENLVSQYNYNIMMIEILQQKQMNYAKQGLVPDKKITGNINSMVTSNIQIIKELDKIKEKYEKEKEVTKTDAQKRFDQYGG